MQAKDVLCGEAIGEVGQAALLCLFVFVCVMADASAPPLQASPAPSHAVAASEQSARDNERMEILRQELKKSEEQMEGLVRRRAERIAASDMQAANEAEEQHARVLRDIAAIKREMASTSLGTGRAAALRPVAGRPAESSPSASKGTAPMPWWDVYGSGRRTGLPASHPLASTPEQGVRSTPRSPTGVVP
ncbi:hypothetical protein SAMN05518854_114129 [Variovorax sp. YR266]|uniref:hypothetical protein n=1 Tax=Variovorax sp. YR266 TaxID=1884386 RepID=UPI000895539F|nr:hypothetical protein [Variovorax sp. YR266]SDZ70553.1 hypothetical protein SAMN05518854_114129 [Variovorax sp. YR266]